MKKVLTILLAVLLVITLAVGCASEPANSNPPATPDKEEPPVKVNIAVPDGITTLSIIKMLKEKPSMGENAEVSYQVVKSPDLMASIVISKEADVVMVPTNLASMLHSKNVPYTLVSSNVWGVLYVASTEDIKGWDDLKGKQVSNMGRGLTPDVTMRYLLEKNGINPDNDITLDYLTSGQELAQAMIGGKITTAVLPEPVLTQVLMKKPEAKVVLDLQKEWAKVGGTDSSYPQASLLISNALIESNPKVVAKILEEFASSAKWVNENHETAGIWAEELETGMNAKVVEKALERSNIRFVPAQEAKPAIEAYLNVLMNFSPETVGGKLPDETFYFQK